MWEGPANRRGNPDVTGRLIRSNSVGPPNSGRATLSADPLSLSPTAGVQAAGPM